MNEPAKTGMKESTHPRVLVLRSLDGEMSMQGAALP